MVDLVWTSPAFLVLETLSEKIAFGIVRHVDHLREFPEIGSKVRVRSKSMVKFRQLIFRRKFRVIYEFDEYEKCVYVLNLQDCRQKLPTARDLKRERPDGELPLD